MASNIVKQVGYTTIKRMDFKEVTPLWKFLKKRRFPDDCVYYSREYFQEIIERDRKDPEYKTDYVLAVFAGKLQICVGLITVVEFKDSTYSPMANLYHGKFMMEDKYVRYILDVLPEDTYLGEIASRGPFKDHIFMHESYPHYSNINFPTVELYLKSLKARRAKEIEASVKCYSDLIRMEHPISFLDSPQYKALKKKMLENTSLDISEEDLETNDIMLKNCGVEDNPRVFAYYKNEGDTKSELVAVYATTQTRFPYITNAVLSLKNPEFKRDENMQLFLIMDNIEFNMQNEVCNYYNLGAILDDAELYKRKFVNTDFTSLYFDNSREVKEKHNLLLKS